MAKWWGLLGSDDDNNSVSSDDVASENKYSAEAEDMVNESSNAEISALASMIGFSTADLSIPEIRDELKKTISVGMGGGVKDDKFVDFWDKAGFTEHTARTNQSRIARYKRYQFMLSQSSEINMAVKTYIDEAESAIREEDEYFQTEVQDKDGKRIDDLSKFVTKSAEALGLLTDPRLILGNLSVNGDHFFRIGEIRKSKSTDNPTHIVDGWLMEGYHINEPARVDRYNLPHKDVPFRFVQYGSVSRTKGKSIFPWDMIHFRLDTVRLDIYPYGESLIESVRSVYKRLLILEALLALTRASRVEHLLIKVPTNNDNPDVQVTKLMRFAPLIKNIMLGGGLSMKQEKKNIAFSDILFMPKGKDAQSSFEMERLASSVDLSTIEDVEYFQDKVTNGLNLPRGWLKSDDAYMGYRKLAMQDLRLARVINTLLKSMARSQTLAAKIILHKIGKWEPEYKVVTSYNPPAPIASEQLQSLSEALDVITSMVEATGTPDPESGEVPKDPDMLRKLLIKIAKLPSSTVDVIIPQSTKTEELTTEEVKKRVVMAFCDMGSEKVTSNETPLVWYELTTGNHPVENSKRVTEEMIQ